jgi:hypothetical protein
MNASQINRQAVVGQLSTHEVILGCAGRGSGFWFDTTTSYHRKLNFDGVGPEKVISEKAKLDRDFHS